MVNSYDRKWNGDIRISDDVAGEDVEDGSDSQSELLGQPVIYGRLTLGESLCPGNVEAGIIGFGRVNSNKRKGCPIVGAVIPDLSYCGERKISCIEVSPGVNLPYKTGEPAISV